MLFSSFLNLFSKRPREKKKKKKRRGKRSQYEFAALGSSAAEARNRGSAMLAFLLVAHLAAAEENAAPKRPTISHSRRVKLDQSTSVLFGGSSDENRGQFTLGPTAPAGRFKMGVKIGHY